MELKQTRRNFLGMMIAAAAGLELPGTSSPITFARSGAAKPAILGGSPVRTESFPSWPQIAENDEKNWEAVLLHKEWCRLGAKPSCATQFEGTWKSMTGAKYCLATASGTTALLTSLNALDVGPGDEVLVPPYTFVATVNVVLLQHALPVFVDTDRETFQIDANKVEAVITPQTKCILPVHLGGSPANMDKILEVARNHNLPVLEDACQAHFAEWRHQSVGQLGDLGCFSFQGSKNLNCGEGGAILSNHQELIERCMSFHNNGRTITPSGYRDTDYVINGSNHRITEFQGALLITQVTRLEAQSRTRTANATYLTKLLSEIPGITPAHMYDGCTRNAYHLYMLRYDKDRFEGLPRDRFLKALEAEGIPCDKGYTPLNKQQFIEASLNSGAFRKIYTEQELARYRERNHCPENDRLCGEAVWFFQTMLLGTRQDMDQIAEAIRKIQQHAEELVRS
jgi:dTDP-4-amino-4,6-dideoxygalactose transaminase